ncbi:MAG: cytochrome c oxidase subunit II [Paracoccaceae bacterium]
MDTSEPKYVQDPPGTIALWPDSASTMSDSIDYALLALIGVSLFLTILIGLLTVVFSVRYRAAAGGERDAPVRGRKALMIEIAWSIPTILIFLGLFWWTGRLYVEQYRMPEDALPVDVVAKQWMWKAQHPSGVREINELHVPVGQKVMLRLTSQDVIHSFYVPEFRVKRDAIPGHYTTMWFEATKPGEYALFCAEYCGVDHSRMRGRVVAMRPDEFETWLGEQDVPISPAEEGEQLFSAYGCAGCHMGTAAVRAPNLAGIYGKPQPVGTEGETVIADHAYIRDSILLPKKHVVSGYQPIMPSFRGQMSEADILAIIAYIRTLDAVEASAR